MIKVQVVPLMDKTLSIGPKTHDAMMKALKKASFDTMSLASIRVPVDTGNLKGSIRDDLENLQHLEASVTAGAEYAAYVEFGTHNRPGKPYLINSGDEVGAELHKVVAAIIKADLG